MASVSGCDYALYLIRRQGLTAAAGVVWLTDRRLFFGALPKTMFG
jgi:hypothetical protein